jgi:hypothetical protein
MLRSLGDPPIGRGQVAGHYFDVVVERAAAVAVALALSAGLMADGSDGEADEGGLSATDRDTPSGNGATSHT